MAFRFEEAKWNKETGMWDFENEKPDPNFFGGLGPMNTVADFISELNDSFFRDILGNETMDKALGELREGGSVQSYGQDILEHWVWEVGDEELKDW